jgi:hypothetical protein
MYGIEVVEKTQGSHNVYCTFLYQIPSCEIIKQREYLLVFSNNLRTYGQFRSNLVLADRLCGLVVRVLGYRSGGPGSIPGTT